MKLFRVCKLFPPDNSPLDGIGSEMRGGRWNWKGCRTVYLGETLTTSLKELEYYIPLSILQDYFIFEIEIADECIEDLEELPGDWEEDPYPISTQIIAPTNFNKGILAFRVPSKRSPSNFNVVVNPSHPDINKHVHIKNSYPFNYNEYESANSD